MLEFGFAAAALAGLTMAGFGYMKGKRGLLAGGLITAAAVVSFMWFMTFYADLLWFDALDYSRRFWTAFLARMLTAGGAALLAAAMVFFLVPARKTPWWHRWALPGVAALLGFSWGKENWDLLLRYLSRVQTGTPDPIWGKDVGFYLFSLPLYDTVWGIVIFISSLCLLATLFTLFIRLDTEEGQFLLKQTFEEDTGDNTNPFRPLYLNLAVFLTVAALGFFLRRYHLMYSSMGSVVGPGWTDVHIRNWSYAGMGILSILCLILLLIPAVRRRLPRFPGKESPRGLRRHLPLFIGLAGILGAGYALSLALLPGLVQRFRVEPNEITFERPYIEHNIRFTRKGFNLQGIEERRFPVSGQFTRQMKADNQALFSNIRLWDWRALDAVYKQFQEIRLYYEFQDVDIDRYTIDGNYRQVMVSARELNLSNLPDQSRTFVNERFKYTHGYGITLTNVNEFTPQGLPNLLIRDIPPVSSTPSLSVDQPRIYYGEATASHVIVNSREKEFDYPSGRENMYNRYDGSGGVRLANFWRKLVYSWKFDGIRLLLSKYPTTDSRIMYRRQIRERVQALAPFLILDEDPYIVLDKGRLYWILDAYTATDKYPYSEPFIPEAAVDRSRWQGRDRGADRFAGANYVRNSVKCVVDAYNGSVDFYVFDPSDHLIRVWQDIFPDLFKSADEMPETLAAHVRYPSDMLLLQGLVYAKYHMTDPQVFYNQEDLWVRATEKYYSRVVPVQPYYILWEPPGAKAPEFSLVLPFTPKNRQVSIGWIAGLCDPGNYSRLIAYQFPKEKRILGPQQVETKIDQDSYLSGQFTLWDQRGSNVIRGNVLAIPVEETILYVEPIYLQAETAAYPELRLVAVMHQDTLSYAESFEAALEGLFKDGKAAAAAPEPGSTAALESPSFRQMVLEADQAFNTFLDALGNREYTRAARAVERLEERLKALKQVQEKEGDPGS